MDHFEAFRARRRVSVILIAMFIWVTLLGGMTFI